MLICLAITEISQVLWQSDEKLVKWEFHRTSCYLVKVCFLVQYPAVEKVVMAREACVCMFSWG